MQHKLIRYSMQIAMLRQLLALSLINENESVAQQEVENISANVKKSLKMKMRRGELVGFQSCLGYDYDKNTKKISVNYEEAEIVRYIFDRYISGMGAYVIAKELTDSPHKTRK